MGKRTGNGLLLTVTIVLTLAVAEVALRASGIARMTARFTCFDPVIGKVYCPLAEGTYIKTTYTHHLAINSAGMVDREYPVLKPEGTLRVALLGDSFTASEYLPTKDKFEGLLEQDLSARLGKPVEILNFGISGNDTWNELQIFHLRAVRYQPDVTFLAFYWGNDIGDNLEELRSGSPNPLTGDYHAPLAGKIREVRKNINKALWNNSALYQVTHDGYSKLERLVKHWFRPKYIDQINRLMVGEQQHTVLKEMRTSGHPMVDTDIEDDDLFFWNSDGWKITRKLIRKLNAEVIAAGSRLVVLHFPSEGLVRSRIPLPYKEFDAFLDQNSIPHVSLFQGYYGMQDEELERHFIPDDAHWTRHGHRFVARQTRQMLFNALSNK